MHKTTAVLLLLVAAALAYPQMKDIDRIIDEIFGGPQATNTNDTTDKNTKDNTDKSTVDNTDKNTDASRKDGLAAFGETGKIDRIIDEIFGGSKATNTTDTTDKNTKDNTDKSIVDNTDKNTDASRKDGLTAFRETGEPCIILNIAGVCTPYYKCKNDIISKDGVIDLANEEDQYYCASYLDVCCTKEKTMDKVDVEGQ